MHSDPKPILNRLRRIEGQVRGIERMVQEDVYCVDVLTQVAAVQTALEQVAAKVLEDHVRGCVAGAVAQGGAEGEAKLEELMVAIGRFTRGRARLIADEPAA